LLPQPSLFRVQTAAVCWLGRAECVLELCRVEGCGQPMYA
jgi:hypothetical protein